jgi:hypothetical protein
MNLSEFFILYIRNRHFYVVLRCKILALISATKFPHKTQRTKENRKLIN